MTYIFCFLDNTFFGTLSAGILLALFGLFLYRKQKEIDLKYEESHKIRELASLLFANMEMGVKNYEGQINVNDGKNPWLKKLLDEFNQKFDDHFRNETDNLFNTLSLKIGESADELVAKLKIYDGDYENEIKVIVDKIPTIILCLSGWMILAKSTTAEIEEFEKSFTEATNEIKKVLQGLIKQK